MWEHVRDIHGGAVGADEGRSDFKMSATGVFKKCLERQNFKILQTDRRKGENCPV